MGRVSGGVRSSRPGAMSVLNGLRLVRRPAIMCDMTKSRTVVFPVLIADEQATWQLQVTTGTPFWLEARDGVGGRVRASGFDIFEALMNLRLELEPLGIQACLNGARRNAWSSFMQRDMGEGEVVYLLTPGNQGRAPHVWTLEPAPCSAVATVAQQLAFYDAWRAALPDPPARRFRRSALLLGLGLLLLVLLLVAIWSSV